LTDDESSSDISLSKYFKDSNFGDIQTPGVIMDCHGKILVWHLPGALTKSRLVRLLQQL
jgi:hypothetical protein